MDSRLNYILDFKNTKTNSDLVTPISSHLFGFMGHSRGVPTGDVGIELEFEGEGLLRQVHHDYDSYDGLIENGGNLPAEWREVSEGSLRGESAEYVLDKPLDWGEAEKALRALWDNFEKYGTSIYDSHRTSMHVHLNCLPLNIKQVGNLICTYGIFEDILLLYSGENRVGNMFCLGIQDAKAIKQSIRKFLAEPTRKNIPASSYHYSAINLHALEKFGSIEIRTMRGPKKVEEALEWLKVMELLYKFAKKIDNPPQILEIMRNSSLELEVFGEEVWNILNKVCETSGVSTKAALEEGRKRMMSCIFARKWDESEKIAETDIFGRKIG